MDKFYFISWAQCSIWFSLGKIADAFSYILYSNFLGHLINDQNAIFSASYDKLFAITMITNSYFYQIFEFDLCMDISKSTDLLYVNYTHVNPLSVL